MGECFGPRCGYDDEHEHSYECTTDCPCGTGEMSADGEWLDLEDAAARAE